MMNRRNISQNYFALIPRTLLESETIKWPIANVSRTFGTKDAKIIELSSAGTSLSVNPADFFITKLNGST